MPFTRVAGNMQTTIDVCGTDEHPRPVGTAGLVGLFVGQRLGLSGDLVGQAVELRDRTCDDGRAIMLRLVPYG